MRSTAWPELRAALRRLAAPPPPGGPPLERVLERCAEACARRLEEPLPPADAARLARRLDALSGRPPASGPRPRSPR